MTEIRIVTILLVQKKKHVVVIVEHYLLLHDARVVLALDGMIFLDPTASTSSSCDDDNDHHNECNNSTSRSSDMDAMWLCLERRVLRNPNRTATETLYMCRYYQDHVWPNYKKFMFQKAKDMCETRGKTFVRIDCRRHATDEIVDYVKDSLVTSSWLCE
jgi:uridine kinase